MSSNDTDATTVISPVAAVTAFPGVSVEACLRAQLIEAVKSEAAIRGVSLPSDPAQIAKAPVQIDSLVAVTILCSVEPILAIKLPASVVRAGGYASVDDALGHLLPRIEKEWKKRTGATP